MVMKRYADDYETVMKTDEKGREKKIAVYRGDYFECSLDQAGLGTFKRKSRVFLGLAAVLHISGGFINNQGMFQFYVALPYVFAFFPLMYMAAGVLRLPKEKRKYRRDEMGLSFDRIKLNSRGLLFFLGMGTIGEILFLVFGTVSGQRLLEYWYLALEMMTAAAVYLLIRLQKQICVQPCSKA
jgi:hypothetical protein